MARHCGSDEPLALVGLGLFTFGVSRLRVSTSTPTVVARFPVSQCRRFSTHHIPNALRRRRAHLLPKGSEHLSRFTQAALDSPVFTGRKGTTLTRNSLQADWERARLMVGQSDLRLRDLRHTGLTLAAATGATAAEPMHRAGYATSSAAQRYQHATKDRDRVIADSLEKMVEEPRVASIRSGRYVAE
jgi:hypothetical protein